MDKFTRNPNDSNKGLDTRKFMISVGVALVLMFLAALLVVGTHEHSLLWGVTHPKRATATTPE